MTQLNKLDYMPSLESLSRLESTIEHKALSPPADMKFSQIRCIKRCQDVSAIE